jgi:hypothetical protein
MADSIPCKNCGHYETEHGYVSLEYMGIDENVLLSGYNVSLKECLLHTGGYYPEDPVLAKELEERARLEDYELFSC